MSLVLDCLYLLTCLYLLPVWLLRLPRARRYRAGSAQRLGFSPCLAPGVPRLWMHCASVGEAGIPRRLLERLAERFPGWQVVFSTNTDTGAQRLRELYPDAVVFYMPFDLSACVRRALQRVRPRAVVLVELEVWPNFLLACSRMGVPVAVINGRIGERSRLRLRGLLGWLPRMWGAVRLCCARSEDDAAGFRQAGLPAVAVCVTGSLKYDLLPAAPDTGKARRLAALFGIEPGAPMLMAGSTHAGEEAILADVYRELKAGRPGLRMVVVPRHVERAAEAASALAARGLPVARKTDLDAGRSAPPGAVIVVDTIGELADCYALATCAFVGRSLLAPGGGQNMMEPAGLGVPVIVGPYTGNFKPEMKVLLKRGAAVVVADGRELAAVAARLLDDPAEAQRMGSAGRAVIAESRGATERTLERLAPLLERAG